MVVKVASMGWTIQQVTAVAWGLTFCMVLSQKTCYDSLKDNNVIPDYADEVGSINLTLCSQYTQIECGKNYAPSILEKRPTCYFTPPDGCNYLAVMLFGSNEDSKTTNLLWFVYNVPAEEIRTGFTGQEGNEMVIYKAPKTSNGSPVGHVFFVYCQDNGDKMYPFYCCGPDQRANFDVKDFATSRSFGQPVAGIYFGVTATGQIMNSTTYSRNVRSGACPK